MKGAIETENTIQPRNSDAYKLEFAKGPVKVTGIICIGCAVIAVILSFSSLYFVFFFLSAVFGLLAYSEIKAIGSGWISSIFLLLSSALLLGVLLSALSNLASPEAILQKALDTNVRIIPMGAILYGICVTIIPVMLTVLVLFARKVAIWKAFVPIVIPVLHIFALVGVFVSKSFLFFKLGILLMPLSWALLGVVAFRGNRTDRTTVTIAT